MLKYNTGTQFTNYYLRCNTSDIKIQLGHNSPDDKNITGTPFT